MKLRHLEKNLLQVLNEVKGRILDDDTVISTLETLKKEAAEVGRKVEETDEVMKEIEMTSQQYMPLSLACSSIYFTIDNLHQVHYLYQYSLKFFMDIFTNLLVNNPALNDVKDYAKRLQIITQHLFESCFNRVTRGMLHDDRIVFGLLLAKIYLRGKIDLDQEFNYLLRGQDHDLDSDHNKDLAIVEDLREKFTYFKNFTGANLKSPDFGSWMTSATPEDQVPKLWNDEASAKEMVIMRELLLVKSFRADRLVQACSRFVTTVLGPGFNSEKELDLSSIVENEVNANTPILMCSVAGFDASSKLFCFIFIRRVYCEEMHTLLRF